MTARSYSCHKEAYGAQSTAEGGSGEEGRRPSVAMRRPAPPEALLEPGGLFWPAPEMAEFMRAKFIDARGDLSNADHAHLNDATIACIWTNVENVRGQRSIAGEAEMFNPKGGKWQRARHESVVRALCDGSLPDFLLTLYAPYFAFASDGAFCAGLEHELYHCGQALDEYGSPWFRRDGTPVFQIVGHEVEEFVGVVRRYGAGVAAGLTWQLVEAANRAPEITAADVDWACGNCVGHRARRPDTIGSGR